MQLTTDIVKLFQTTKEERLLFSSQLVEKLQDGYIDPLTLHLQVKCMEDVVKQITSNSIYKKSIVDAAELQGQKSFDFHNAKFEIKETGVKYDFSKCNDAVYEAMLTQQVELDAKIKARETMLKSVSQKGMTITDEETGETFTVYPPAKSSTTNVAVTLK